MNRPAISYPTPQVFQATFDLEAEQRRAASDPATRPEELRRLYNYRPLDGGAITNALARNPSTPLDMLTTLILEAPSAFCRNPIAPRILLENPNFLEKVSPLGIARLLRLPQAPTTLVHPLAAGGGRMDYLTETARQHIQYREPFGEKEWVNAVRDFLRHALTFVVNDSEKEAVTELAELGVLSYETAAIVGLSAIPAMEDYETLRGRLNKLQAQTLEQGYLRPPHNESRIVAAGDTIYTYIGATFNPWVQPETLLAWHRHPDLARAIARNPNAPPQVLLRLVQNRDLRVRRMALHNPACPAEAKPVCQRFVLARILNYPRGAFLQKFSPSGYTKPWVFGRFVAMLRAPEAVRRPFFKHFATSPIWEDRLAAAIAINDRPNGQPMKPKHRVLLEQLAKDGICLVRAAAQARLRGEVFSLEAM